jgi:PAS domain-containing protein
MEEELQFKNLILSTQQEASIDGIIVVNENREIFSFNHRLVEMWDIPRHLLEGKSHEPIWQHAISKVADPEQFINRARQIYAAQAETSQDEVLLKDGRIFDRYSAPILDADGKYFGRVWYFHDITELKRGKT